jgi:hypothetical protein
MVSASGRPKSVICCLQVGGPRVGSRTKRTTGATGTHADFGMNPVVYFEDAGAQGAGLSRTLEVEHRWLAGLRTAADGPTP